MLHYTEFDTTPQNLMADLRSAILTSTSWSRLTPDTVLLTTSAATTANATVLPFTDTTPAGLAVGRNIMIDNGATREYRTITAMTATSITVAAMTYAHSAATQIRWGYDLYKATTTRGADMIVDLSDQPVQPHMMTLAAYRSHDGTTGVGWAQRWLYWKYTTGTWTMPLHVTLSLSKEHFFLAIEGPRAGEASPASGNYGSQKQYFFLCDLVPYYGTADSVPTVVCGGQMVNHSDSSYANMSHLAAISRNLANTAWWAPARLQTLEFPQGALGMSLNVQRQSALDSKFVLSPYVVFLDDTGMRGRLSHIFYAGNSMADNAEVPLPSLNAKVQHEGQWYKLINANRSDGRSERHIWGPLGAANNSAGTIYMRSPVIAVPCLP